MGIDRLDVEDGVMGRRPRFWWMIVIGLVAACGSDASNVANNRPRLVQEVTLAPTTPAATRFLSPTPSPIVIPVSTSEIVSQLQIVTIDADYVLVTPTLPPSKTPTLTPTQSPQPSSTPLPTLTLPPPSPVTPQIPTAAFVAVTQVIANPVAAPAQNCSANWFFTTSAPSACPSGPSTSGYASLLQFQQGFMIWIEQQDAIYVLYDSANFPRWEVFQDNYTDGIPETDPNLESQKPPYAWQPRRGFGLIWREREDVRSRIGWSVREWEEPFTTQVQVASDGTVYIQESRGGILALTQGGVEWKRWVG
jgi:hypothetical protein